MTKLRKPVQRGLPLAPFNRLEDTAITIYPNGMIGFRKSKTRTEYLYPMEKVYAAAVKQHVEAARKEKKARTK